MKILKVHGVGDVTSAEQMWHVYNPVDILQTMHDAISNT